MRREKRLQTTLGDLIVALTEETARLVHDEKRACEVVAYLLEDLLGHGRRPLRVGTPGRDKHVVLGHG